jgi:hypothetical protein
LNFRGFMDESFNKEAGVFCLSCVIGHSAQWTVLEDSWKQCIDRFNSKLAALGRPPIRRYHASDCNSMRGDFKGWSQDEQREFTEDLFRILNDSHLHVCSKTADWNKFSDFMSEELGLRSTDKAIYCLVLIELLKAIGAEMTKINPQEKISLFHDRTNYDGTIQHIFSGCMNAPNFLHATRFVTLASVSWKDCLALQPADMFAFEASKQHQRIDLGADPRKSFESCLEPSAFRSGCLRGHIKTHKRRIARNDRMIFHFLPPQSLAETSATTLQPA